MRNYLSISTLSLLRALLRVHALVTWLEARRETHWSDPETEPRPELVTEGVPSWTNARRTHAMTFPAHGVGESSARHVGAVPVDYGGGVHVVVPDLDVGCVG